MKKQITRKLKPVRAQRGKSCGCVLVSFETMKTEQHQKIRMAA